MNAYQKSNELGLTGTDAEKVAILQTLTDCPACKQPDTLKAE